MKRILFITQNMERTGSEMVLWHLLNNLDAAKYSVYVFCLKKGALYHSLPSHVQKSVVYKESGSLKNKIWRTLLKVFGVKPLNYQLKDIHQQFKPDYWYVNTLAIPWVYEVAKTINVKVVTHLHELLYAFTFVKRSEFETMLSQSNTVIGCSDMVCEYIKKLGHNDVRLQYSFIDEFNIDVNPEKVEALKKAHGIQADDFVWVISGATTYMKGFDYILGLLDEHKSTNVKFLWIGRQLDDGLNYYIDKISQSIFDGKLIFAGSQSDDYFNYMAIGNGLLLLSREESFSLVTIEAAYLGIPTVGFNVGIAKLFIKEGMGEIVEEGDLAGLKRSMNKCEHQHFEKSFLRSQALEFGIENQVLKFQKLLDSI